MKCELCGYPIPAPGGDCPFCSSADIRKTVEEILHDAIAAFSHEASTRGASGELCFQVGNFYRLGGMYDEAVTWYERALAAKDPKPEYYRSLATALAAKGDFKAAVEMMKKAVALEPAYPDYHNDLGAAYFKDGKHDEAMAEFNEALRLNPRYANAHNNLAFVYRKKGKYQEAEKEIEQAIQLDPEHAIAAYELGRSYFSGGMFSQLREAFRIGAKVLADICMTRRRYPEAVRYYLKALEIHPDYADTHCSLGMAYAVSGDKPKAREAFLAALKINPRYAKAKAELEKLGDA